MDKLIEFFAKNNFNLLFISEKNDLSLYFQMINDIFDKNYCLKGIHSFNLNIAGFEDKMPFLKFYLPIIKIEHSEFFDTYNT